MVTQVIDVPAGSVKVISEQIGRFLSSSKAGLVALPESDRIIVTDYESRLAMVGELVTLLATTHEEILVETLEIDSGNAEELAEQISGILAETHRARGRKGNPPVVRSDLIPGTLVTVGTQAQIDEATALAERLHQPTDELQTVPYSPRYLSLNRVQQLLENVALAPGSGVPRPTAVYTDAEGARLFVTAGQQTHAAIAAMLEREDQPFRETQRPLRIHRPKHRKAAELVTAVGELLGAGATMTITTPQEPEPAEEAPKTEWPPRPPEEQAEDQIPTARDTRVVVQGRDYVLTVDEPTNSIIAIGTREFHAQLEVLLDELDIRRPQVLIQMTLVAITMSDTLDLGVELEALDLGDAWDYILFSSFGLSEVDPLTGARTLIPGTGANGVLIRPDSVPVVIRALATKADARIMSTPKLLVADNARGTLRNVDEQPFTNVNASQTVATTSFGGFESAGTTLSVTPQILEGDFVSLEYELTFSNFTGSSSLATVPPPRSTNSFTSQVEVPDGYTLITGGLIVDAESDSVSEVPLLGRIPGIGALFRSSGKQNTKTKIFAFITPTVVREDKFEALKYITLKDIEHSGVRLNPNSDDGPMWMR